MKTQKSSSASNPAGVPVQTSRAGETDLTSALKNYRAKKGEEPYIGLIHRLDQPVRGIMVFAKTREAAAALSRQVSQRQITKEYLAVVCSPADPESLPAADRSPADTGPTGPRFSRRLPPSGQLHDYLAAGMEKPTPPVSSLPKPGRQRSASFLRSAAGLPGNRTQPDKDPAPYRTPPSDPCSVRPCRLSSVRRHKIRAAAAKKALTARLPSVPAGSNSPIRETGIKWSFPWEMTA